MPESAARGLERCLAWGSGSGLALVSFLLLLAGSLGGLAALERCQPLDAAAVLGGFAIGLVALWVVLLAKAGRLARPASMPSPRAISLLWPAFAPWLFAGFLWVNAALDRSPPRSHPTVVVTKNTASTQWVPLFRYEVVVESWRPGRRFEGVLLEKQEEFESYEPGDAVLVQVGSGFLGLPWIVGLRKQCLPGGSRQFQNRFQDL